MQRLAAIALLAVLACLTGAPFASAFESADAGLPACCRAAGAHHCLLRDAPVHTHGVIVTGTRCGDYPRHSAALLETYAGALAPQALGVAFSATPFLTLGALACYAEERRTRSPRGPPALLPRS